MVTEIGNVRLIYAEADLIRAEEIRSFLEEKLADGRKAPQDAAVILISDAAVKDLEGWQKEVSDLSDNVRRIPVGRTENANFSKEVPAKIREINYIHADDDMLENILDSIMIDSDFYRMRGEVLLQMGSYEASGHSEAFLMEEGRRIRQYRAMTAQKAATETEPRFKEQLQQMEEFLDLSKKHARKIFFYNLRRWVSVSLLIAVLVFFIVASYFLFRIMRRASDEAALLGTPRNEDNAAENVILLLDGIGNPLINDNVRSEFFYEMYAYLDLNWCTTPIGYNYKHKLTDAQLLANERYLATTVSNGKMLFWDTYTGRIKEEQSLSNVPLKAFHTNSDANIAVVVTEENKVLFGIGKQWLTNNNSLFFTGNTKIHVDTDSDNVLIYDDQHLYFYQWSTEGEKIKPVSYIAEETVKEPFAILSARLTDTGYSAAMRKGESIYFLKETRSGYNLEIAPSQTCVADLLGDRMIFADSEGNIMLFDESDMIVRPVGLRLPQPKILRFVNDSTIAYHDGFLGTHLYDIDQNIDLGEIFSSFEELTDLEVTETSAVCFANGTYVCQPINTFLPRQEPDPASMLVCDSDSAQGNSQIKSAKAVGTNAVSVNLLASRVETEISLRCKGRATAVGLIDSDRGVVIGTEDGYFTELVFRDNGSYIRCANIQVPSHAAIRSIYESQDCYWVMDEEGNYWWARLGYPATESPELIIEQINGKLHRGVTKKLLDSVSKDTIETLNLKMMPGGDGKEWE